jgi:hypothetical protein
MSLSRCCAVLLASGLMFVAGLSADAREPSDKRRSNKRPPKPPAEARQQAGAEAVHNSLVVTQPGAAELKIRKTLEDPTIIEFVETPLQDVVDYLKDYHKIEIQLDKRALDDAGLGTDTPISRNLRGISLRSALDLMLDSHNLAWTIDHEVLHLTTTEAAQARRETCVYNVRELIGEGTAEELAQIVWKSLVPVEQRDDSADLSILPYRHLLIVRHSQEGQRRVTQLLEQLQSALVPAK